MDEPTPRDDETSSARASPADEPSPEGEEASSTPGKPVDEPTEESDKSLVSEPPGSDAEPPKQPRRSNEFWLGALGIIATVLAAFVGAVATYFTGIHHDNQETQRAQNSFTQSQQVQAYAAFSSAASKFQNSWNAAITDITSGNISHSSTPAEDDMTTSFNNLVDASAHVSFFASKEVDTATIHMMRVAVKVIEYVKSHPSPADGSAFSAKVEEIDNDMHSTSRDFICAVRKDLRVTGASYFCPGQ